MRGAIIDGLLVVGAAILGSAIGIGLVLGFVWLDSVKIRCETMTIEGEEKAPKVKLERQGFRGGYLQGSW